MLKILNDLKDLKDKRIAIFGTGETASDFYQRAKNNLDVGCFLETHLPGQLLNLPVHLISSFDADNYDGVVIASCFWDEIIEREASYLKYVPTYILSNELLFNLTELSVLEKFKFNPNELINKKKLIDFIRNNLSDERSKEIYDYHLEFRNNNETISKLMDFAEIKSNKEPYFEFKFDIQNGHVFDIGAFDGAETIQILKDYPKINQIHIFEPNISSIKNSENYNELLLSEKVILNFKALSNMDGKSYITFAETQTNINDKKKNDTSALKVEVTTIDKYWDNSHRFDLKFLKMDIEGFELKAMEGALTCLKDTRPILAISLYHRKSDLLKLPEILMNNLKEYKFYVRAYTSSFIDTIFYAVPMEANYNEY